MIGLKTRPPNPSEVVVMNQVKYDGGGCEVEVPRLTQIITEPVEVDQVFFTSSF